MTTKRSLYLVPSTLDAPTRILGLPLDEAIPAFSLAVWFFFLDHVVLSIGLPILTVLLLRGLKRGRGSAWLWSLCYWYLPSCVTRHWLRYTPPSQHRQYLA